MKKSRKQRLRRIAERTLERRRAREEKGVTGIIRMTHSGFGFVAPESPETEQSEPAQDIFIPAKYVGDALDGDRVRVQLLPPRRGYFGEADRGPCGKVLEVLERNRTEFVGELLAGSRVRPLNPRLPDEIALHGPRHGAGRGDWVRVKFDEHNGRRCGVIRELLGRAGVLAADLDAVMAEYDLPPRYTAGEEAAAAAIVPREIDRQDCRKLFVITIDPFDAKDFDDALSIAPGTQPGSVEVGIHIADVAAYIPPKSRFDEAAKMRGFSCYLPGRTLPMLPAGLTARISMQQGADSLAHSVFLTVDQASGKIISGRREHTLIRVASRLNYDEVQEFLDHETVPETWGPGVREAVKLLAETTRAMRSFRDKEEQFIDLPLPEIRVICDEKENKITGLSAKTARESENIVEECMLAANQFVGSSMVEKMVAGIYRVHPLPDEERTTEFAELMRDSFKLPVGDISNRVVCREFIRTLPDDGRRSVILGLLLRALPRAGYAVKPELHFALGKTQYCHFTSPIRRYTDLIVHQQLWNSDLHIRTRSGRTLETVAAWCTEQEELLDTAYFAASDRMKLRYLEEQLEHDVCRIYEGVIVKVLASGFQVDIQELGLYGFVPRERMRGSFRRHRFTMNDDRDDTIYRPGNYLYLRLDNIDFARGTANFLPAGR